MTKLDDQIKWYAKNHNYYWEASPTSRKLAQNSLIARAKLIDINSVDYTSVNQTIQLIDMINCVKKWQSWQSTLNRLLEISQRIANGGTYRHGICAELFLSNNDSNIIKELAPKWRHYSGDIEFPVPGIEYSPKDAFYKYSEKNKWSNIHPYGAMRLDLLRYLIDTITKRLNEYNENSACPTPAG